MAKIEEKKPIVEEIKENIEGAKSVVLVDYLGLTVEQDTKLRKEAREAGIVYKVYKNTMVNLAVQGTEFEELTKDLEGPTALAISKEDEAKYTIRRIHIKAMIKSIVLANFFIAFPHIVFDTDTYILPQQKKIIKCLNAYTSYYNKNQDNSRSHQLNGSKHLGRLCK